MSHAVGRKPTGGLALLACALLATTLVAGCAGRVDRHGHVLAQTDLQRVQPGMSKEEVKLALGTPDTTSSAGGDAFYYISSTHRTRPAQKTKEVDRKVVAVYFDNRGGVTQVADYGLKDGVVFDYIKQETPSHGKEASLLEQMFGNLGTRREYAKQLAREGQARVPGQ